MLKRNIFGSISNNLLQQGLNGFLQKRLLNKQKKALKNELSQLMKKLK